MTNPVDPLVHEALELRAAWEATARPHVPRERSMSDSDLVGINQMIGELRKKLDGLHTRVAAEIASRSRPELGRDSMSRKRGFRTPAKLIAATTGTHPGDAARLIEVGEASRERTLLSGATAPARHPHVGDAVREGRVSVAAAAAVNRMLDRIALRVAPDVLDGAERTLAERAPLLTFDELQLALRRVEALLDPDGLEPAIDGLRAEASMTLRQDASGMTVLRATLDPESAAPVIAAIESIVTHQLRVNRGRNLAATTGVETRDGDGGGAGSRARADIEGHADAGESTPDATSSTHPDSASAPASVMGGEIRSLGRMKADALVAICRHVLGCDENRVPAASTTVVVRMTLDQLRPETAGLATIDGLEQPIDAGTARRMAAKAGIIPAVLGGGSAVLDLGRERRSFTREQRLVLAERDGGCAGCHLPPSFCEAHHRRRWSDGGSSDLDEGVLLCTGCHHRVHDDGWEIRIDTPPGARPHAGTVWFIPPASIDPARTPRLGGRQRFDPLVWPLAG